MALVSYLGHSTIGALSGNGTYLHFARKFAGQRLVTFTGSGVADFCCLCLLGGDDHRCLFRILHSVVIVIVVVVVVTHHTLLCILGGHEEDMRGSRGAVGGGGLLCRGHSIGSIGTGDAGNRVASSTSSTQLGTA